MSSFLTGYALVVPMRRVVVRCGLFIPRITLRAVASSASWCSSVSSGVIMPMPMLMVMGMSVLVGMVVVMVTMPPGGNLFDLDVSVFDQKIDGLVKG